MVVLPECKCEPTDEEKRGPLYCRYYKRCDHHTWIVPTALQREEEDNGEVVEPKRPSKIRRTTRPDGKVVYEF